MTDWWANNGPPVYLAVAAYLGMVKQPGKADSKPTPQPTAKASEPGNLNELLRMAGAGGIIH